MKKRTAVRRAGAAAGGLLVSGTTLDRQGANATAFALDLVAA
ncbi:MAG: hypothetical protein ACRD07_19300 [Acidimicrobiales bacterium]